MWPAGIRGRDAGARQKKGKSKMATRPKPRLPLAQKYSWSMDSSGVYCFKSPAGYQTVKKLWEADELTSFHDAKLAQTTTQINAILSRLDKSNKDPQRSLSFIQVQNRLLLCWAKYDAIGPVDDDETIVKALKLSREGGS
jgi:hypothetical protein